MKRGFRMLMAALCSVVFLCGFSVTAYAGGGDEVMDYGEYLVAVSYLQKHDTNKSTRRYRTYKLPPVLP